MPSQEVTFAFAYTGGIVARETRQMHGLTARGLTRDIIDMVKRCVLPRHVKCDRRRARSLYAMTNFGAALRPRLFPRLNIRVEQRCLLPLVKGITPLSDPLYSHYHSEASGPLITFDKMSI